MRRGFSLVELVFAIVIIAITLMSIPMLLGESAKSNSYTLVQESLLAARTKIGDILSYPWDNNSTEYDANGALVGAIIVDVKNGDPALDRNKTNFRKGEPIGGLKNQGVRRHFSTSELNATFADDPDNGVPDDMDDFDGKSSSITVISLNNVDTNDTDYLSDDLKMMSNVYFVNDNANYDATTINFDFNVSSAVRNIAQSKNIKMIELKVHSSFMDENFTLRSFSCNIGSINHSLLHEEKR